MSSAPVLPPPGLGMPGTLGLPGLAAGTPTAVAAAVPHSIDGTAAARLGQLVGAPSAGRGSLQDVWLPHLFAKDFVPYTPGKHVEIPLGADGAVLSSNEHPYGPAPSAMRDLLADGVMTLFDRMGIGDRVADAMSLLGNDKGIFRGLSEAFRQYIDDYGPFADLYARHIGHGITGAQIYVAAGGSQLIYKLIRATNPQRGAVMAFMPGFFMYPIGAMAEGRPFHSVFLNDDLSYPLDHFLEEAERVNPGLVIVDTPNNPTGGVVPKDWLVKLIEAQLARNGYVLVDEAYFDFRRDDAFTALSLLDRYPNVIVLRSFSKYPGLAGGRIGFGIAARDSVAQTLFGRIKTPFEVATVTINLATHSLKPEAQSYLQMRADEIATERGRVDSELNAIRGIRTFQSHANFILVDVKGTGKTAAQVKAELEKRNLYVRPLPPNPQFVPPHIAGRYELLRVTIGTPSQNDQLLAALRDIAA